MKKLFVLAFAAVSLLTVLGVGCSSTQKKSDDGAVQAAPAVESPVNLGASSSGRAI